MDIKLRMGDKLLEKKSVTYDVKRFMEELGFDTEEVVILFSKYFNNSRESINKMEHYLIKRDWTMLERIVHNIKGVSANLYIMDLYEEAAAFDTLLREGKTDDADIRVKRLRELINNSETEIRRIFSEMDIAL